MKTIEEKASELIEAATLNPGTGCLECTCCIGSRGYGWVGVNGTQMCAHRVVWIAKMGMPHSDLFVLHSCDNRKFINIDHLHLGTARDNNEECVQRGRWKCGKRGLTLTQQKATEIRTRYAGGGVFQKQLAKEYGVTQVMISRIILRKTWKHAA